jgi:hypothetical protein
MRRWAQLIDRPSMALLWAYTALPRLYFELLKLLNLSLMRIRIQILTLMQIRIQ